MKTQHIRTEQITLRLTPEQHEQLKARAMRNKVPVSELARRILFPEIVD